MYMHLYCGAGGSMQVSGQRVVWNEYCIYYSSL